MASPVQGRGVFLAALGRRWQFSARSPRRLPQEPVGLRFTASFKGDLLTKDGVGVGVGVGVHSGR